MSARTAYFLVSMAVYCAFAALVYVLLGPEPPLNIDHISYMRLANEILRDWPNGDYWRTFTSVRAYGVLLAYAYEFTGSHVVSCKLLLAVLTVAYLFAFQLFMGLATKSRAEAMLFSLLSALFVSFGASMWGMTDFSASLNRTLIIPFVAVLFWFFFRYFDTPWRYAIFPALMVLSLLHLSALHVILVFCVFEAVDFALRRRLRPDMNLVWFPIALVLSAAIHFGIDRSGLGATSFVGDLLSKAVPPAKELIAARPPVPPPAEGTAAKPRPKPPAKLAAEEAWRIELMAFPWRNFPLPLATIAVTVLSFGVIFLLALAGAVRAFRGGAVPLDRRMAHFALAVPIAAFGLQLALWPLRGWTTLLPINFEEIRSINLIMFPAVYFVYRLYELAPPVAAMPRRAVQAAIVLAFALQPIVVLRALPESWREGIVDQALALGVIRSSDSPRVLFARQTLNLHDSGPRFYYSSRPLVAWLVRNMKPRDRVLSNVNDLYVSGIKSVGSFLTVLDMQVWEPKRAEWAEALESVDRAMAARDLGQVIALAKSLGATYVVVDWPVEDAVYRDDYFSVVRVR